MKLTVEEFVLVRKVFTGNMPDRFIDAAEEITVLGRDKVHVAAIHKIHPHDLQDLMAALHVVAALSKLYSKG